MKKYKLNKKNQEPSEAVIGKYKDFAQFSHAYQTMTRRPNKPLYKNPKVFLALILVALIAWLIAEGVMEEEKEKTPTKIDQNKLRE